MSNRTRLRALEQRDGGDKACPTCGVVPFCKVRCMVFTGINLLKAGREAAEQLDADRALFQKDGTPAPPACPQCGRWPTLQFFYSRSCVAAQRERSQADNKEQGDHDTDPEELSRLAGMQPPAADQVIGARGQ